MREGCVAFTLIEVLIATIFIAMCMAGLIVGYVQINRLAEWSSMSLAAQSLAQQGMEQARCAYWNSQQYPYTSGPGTGDELPVGFTPGNTWTTNLSGTNYALDVPSTGSPFYATNLITITCVCNTPPLRMIRSDCIWSFGSYNSTSGTNIIVKYFTNTAITYRAPDQ